MRLLVRVLEADMVVDRAGRGSGMFCLIKARPRHYAPLAFLPPPTSTSSTCAWLGHPGSCWSEISVGVVTVNVGTCVNLYDVACHIATYLENELSLGRRFLVDLDHCNLLPQRCVSSYKTYRIQDLITSRYRNH